MKFFVQTPSSWRTFFRQEPRFSIWIVILSILMLLTVILGVRTPEGHSLLCTLPKLDGLKEIVLHYPKI